MLTAWRLVAALLACTASLITAELGQYGELITPSGEVWGLKNAFEGTFKTGVSFVRHSQLKKDPVCGQFASGTRPPHFKRKMRQANSDSCWSSDLRLKRSIERTSAVSLVIKEGCKIAIIRLTAHYILFPHSRRPFSLRRTLMF